MLLYILVTFSCSVGIKISRILGSCLDNLVAADCCKIVREVRAYFKV